MRLSKDDIPDIAFYSFLGTLIWLIVLPIPLAILGGVALGIALVYDEKLTKEAD